ncbi:hypothetical protein, partial [Pseudomonas brassicacearum]|uniref:hypothetical protein n=1 Tax=Pseudomonas brassicacearum TaxID=930166 RepID=UPI001C837A1B
MSQASLLEGLGPGRVHWWMVLGIRRPLGIDDFHDEPQDTAANIAHPGEFVLQRLKLFAKLRTHRFGVLDQAFMADKAQG